MRRFTAAVVGLGQIGQGYDYDKTDDAFVLTHSQGFIHHYGFELIAGVDPDMTQCKRFEEKFRRPAYEDLQALMAHHQPEIFSIGVPTQKHYPVFCEIMLAKPRAVLCEKPIAASLSDARSMVEIAKSNRCSLLVNYMRRFEPGVLILKQILQNKDFGEPYKGNVWYSKGMLNNGSHFLDLLRFLLGEVTQIRVVQKGRRWDGADPEPDVCLDYGGIQVYFLSAREECFSIGEMALVCTKGLISYGESGSLIEARRVDPDDVYSCYTTLGQKRESIPTDLNRYQWHVVDHLYHHLTRGAPLNSDGESALETLRVIIDIENACGGEGCE